MDSTLNVPSPPASPAAASPAPATPGDAGVPSEWAPDSFELTEPEVERLIELSEELTASPEDEPARFCRQAHLASRRLPERLLATLADFASVGSTSGTLVIDRVPLEELPSTPPDNRRHVGKGTRLARVQAVVNHACGDMIGYEAEGYGRLYQDMVPNQALAQSQTSLGSRVELELHTEQAFSQLRPDVLSLACLRGHPDAKTYALPARVLVENLTEAEAALLRKPLWLTGVDVSFLRGGHTFIGGEVRGPLAIIHGAEDDPMIVFDQDLMSSEDEAAQAMVDRVNQIYHAKRVSHTLEPGQILLVDNMRAVHGRSPFQPNFDGADRFIIRSFAVRDLVRTRYARPGNGRVIAAEHS